MTPNAAVLRPKAAAKYLGISISSFWRYAKIDGAFPQPFKVTKNCAVVTIADLDAWISAKRGTST